MKMTLHISEEAMDLFAPLEPCPECKRPLPVPFEDNYQHWDGCSIGMREAEQAAIERRSVVR